MRGSRAGVRPGGEFYVHLNLVRSCETPSDPTRCPLPPWVPLAAYHGLSRPRGSCGIRAACAVPRGGAGCLGSLRRCARHLSLLPRTSQALADSFASCAGCLAGLPGLYPDWFPSLSASSRNPCALLLILSHLVRLCWFRAGFLVWLFQCFAE